MTDTTESNQIVPQIINYEADEIESFSDSQFEMNHIEHYNSDKFNNMMRTLLLNKKNKKEEDKVHGGGDPLSEQAVDGTGRVRSFSSTTTTSLTPDSSPPASGTTMCSNNKRSFDMNPALQQGEDEDRADHFIFVDACTDPFESNTKGECRESKMADEDQYSSWSSKKLKYYHDEEEQEDDEEQDDHLLYEPLDYKRDWSYELQMTLFTTLKPSQLVFDYNYNDSSSCSSTSIRSMTSRKNKGTEFVP